MSSLKTWCCFRLTCPPCCRCLSLFPSEHDYKAKDMRLFGSDLTPRHQGDSCSFNCSHYRHQVRDENSHGGHSSSPCYYFDTKDESHETHYHTTDGRKRKPPPPPPQVLSPPPPLLRMEEHNRQVFISCLAGLAYFELGAFTGMLGPAIPSIATSLGWYKFS